MNCEGQKENVLKMGTKFDTAPPPPTVLVVFAGLGMNLRVFFHSFFELHILQNIVSRILIKAYSGHNTGHKL